MSNKREVRVISGAQIRSKKAEGKLGAVGYAAVFNEVADLGYFKETIAPGAFSRCISEKQDVRCLQNHDANLVMGRTKSGTLALAEDAKGLQFDCNFPDTQAARDLHTLLERGDVDQCSFGFIVRKQSWMDQKDEDGNVTDQTRTIEDVDLLDVSVVTFPAYEGTSCEARALFPDGEPDELAARRLLSEMREAAKTKKVDGKDLHASDFAHVGDPNDTSTWKLPIHDASHVRNALARFNQVQGLSQAEKDAAWKKIVAAAKKFGIKVSEEDAKDLTDLQRRDLGPDDPQTPVAEDPGPHGDGPTGKGKCECECAQCQSGDCSQCSNEKCEDPNCDDQAETVPEDNSKLSDYEAASLRLRVIKTTL